MNSFECENQKIKTNSITPSEKLDTYSTRGIPCAHQTVTYELDYVTKKNNLPT